MIDVVAAVIVGMVVQADCAGAGIGVGADCGVGAEEGASFSVGAADGGSAEVGTEVGDSTSNIFSFCSNQN